MTIKEKAELASFAYTVVQIFTAVTITRVALAARATNRRSR